MDDKKKEAPKITRSQARHLRRKRLTLARKAAENDKTSSEDKSPPETENHRPQSNNTEPKSISRSKARRLRRKSRLTSPQSPPSTSLDNSEINSEINSINSCSTIDDSRSESDKKQELINNEKNLKISEALHNLDNHQSTSELIINNSPIQTQDFSYTSPRNEVSHEVAVSKSSGIDSVELSNNPKQKMEGEGKSREQVKAEREAKKAAKAAAKNKSKAKIAENVPKPIQTNKNPPKNEVHLSPAPSKPQAVLSDEEVEEQISEVTDELSKLKVSDSVPTLKKLAEDTMSPATKEKEKRKVEDKLKQQIKQEVQPVESKPSEGKSKAELRAERRMKQEAQRAAKEAQKKTTTATKPAEKPVEKAKKPQPANVPEKTTEKTEDSPKKVKKVVLKETSHELNLFKHLYHEREQAFLSTPTVNSHIHPAIIRVGIQYKSKVIVGSNARCIALLAAVKQLIHDFERPSQADFTRGLETSLQESSSYLHHCRPMAVSMHNALKYLKWQMTHLPSTISDNEAKAKLENAIDMYIREQILLADEMISITIQTKISNGDVILTYGYSSLIQRILCDAHDKGKKFRVVVVDGRPWLEGKELLRRLAKHGVECSYVLINALSFIMPEVSKVFLGAHAILANGAVMSRAGTAQVALMAKAFNVPVLVACETHKTCERVQTDSIVYNEIGDADELAQNTIGSTRKPSLLTNWRAKKSLNLLNLTYDVTPADLVTAVVTELAILPCTSVPVILRIKPSEF